MSVADLDKVEADLHEALDQHVITVDEFGFLRAVSEDTDATIGGWALIFMFGLATPRMNAEPSQVHPSLRASFKRLGVSLEKSITELPIDFADEPLLRSVWRHLPMLAGLEVHEAIVEVCRLAAEIEGIHLGFIPSGLS